jgi:hypothetical protein
VSLVTNTWSSVSSIISGASQVLNGDTIRVPVGFAGALEFDTDTTPASPIEFGSAITYTTYADNDDEYVGVGDHYGTTVTDLGLVKYSFDQPLDTSSDPQAVTDAATAKWKANGLNPDPSSLSPVTKAFLSKATGLVAVGASKALQTVDSSVAKPGSADSPIGRGLTATFLPE